MSDKPAPQAPLTPLTDEQIDQIVISDAWDTERIPDESLSAWCIRFARAIEAAHGIRAAGVKEPGNAQAQGCEASPAAQG